MRNPARGLLKIFLEWQDLYGPALNVRDARGLNAPPIDAYATHLEAFRYLIGIDHALIYLKGRGIPVRVYLDSRQAWLEIILNSPLNWTGPSDPLQAFPSTAMAHLETLETVLDMDRPHLSPEPEAKLRGAVDSVLGLLAEDATISDALRGYILRLVSEVRTALDDEAIAGSFDFAEAAERLWVAMNAASGQSRTHKAKWKSSAGSFFRDAGAAALGSMPSVAISYAQLLATSAGS